MEEAYEMILGQYRNHNLLGTYLDGEVPAFSYLLPLLDMLSAEERIMVKVAFALYQEERGATVGELLALSEMCFERVVQALRLKRGEKP